MRGRSVGSSFACVRANRLPPPRACWSIICASVPMKNLDHGLMRPLLNCAATNNGGCCMKGESKMRNKVLPQVLSAAALLALVSLAQAAGFALTSPEIKSGGTMPKNFEFNGFGCSGENKSPALKWSGAPAGTKSFAVTVYDPDAPT